MDLDHGTRPDCVPYTVCTVQRFGRKLDRANGHEKVDQKIYTVDHSEASYMQGNDGGVFKSQAVGPADFQAKIVSIDGGAGLFRKQGALGAGAVSLH
jgi:hypothetical protein